MKRRGWILIGLLGCLGAGSAGALPASLQIYDRYGVPVHSVLSSRQTDARPVSLADISPWLVSAVVAAEDKRFFSHGGVDGPAVVRAALQNVRQGKVVSGASTLTQQLVRARQPHPKTWRGKTTEAWQAVQLEKNKTKEEILEDYLNELYLGNLTQGVEAASLFYFGVNAKDVSISQAAFLAGIAKSPTYYNPLRHFSRACQRKNYVLKRMREEGFIEEELYELALQEPVVLRAQKRPFQAPHFVRLLQQQITAPAGEIVSTLDKDLQLQAEQIIKSHLRGLVKENVTNAAVVVLENATGAVLAYVGSADFNNARRQGQVDGVRALRQPGSALKPFVYGLAFEQGLLTPSALLEDEDTFFEDGFRPRNYDESFHGPVSVRRALACSYNIPAVKAAQAVGTGPLLDFLRRAGLESLQQQADFYGLGLSLGNGEVRLLELANAYASLARGGVYKPVLLARQPRTVLPGSERRILSEQAAYLVTDILKDNHARAPAFGLNSPLSVPFDFAAKTGTSKDYKDNFAIGYTPRWTVGVWVGNFDASPMQKVSGITGAGPILHEVAVYLQEKYPSAPFVPPEGLVRLEVCEKDGLPACPGCASGGSDWFIRSASFAACHRRKEEKIPLRIVSPAPADVYQWDPSVPAASQQLKWKASCSAGRSCRWKLDGKIYPQTACEVWWPLQTGKHTLQVFCDNQRQNLSFEVLP